LSKMAYTYIKKENYGSSFIKGYKKFY